MTEDMMSLRASSVPESAATSRLLHRFPSVGLDM